MRGGVPTFFSPRCRRVTLATSFASRAGIADPRDHVIFLFAPPTLSVAVCVTSLMLSGRSFHFVGYDISSLMRTSSR